jgi:hypothetical protein
VCTVTIVRSGDWLRVACNRDERRDRRAAHPPFITRAGDLRVLAPQDPQGCGTWIAANSAGLVFAVLNVNEIGVAPGAAVRSRGLVIPSIADAATVEEVVLRVDRVSFQEYPPFRLVVADRFRAAEFVRTHATGRLQRLEVHRLDRPLLFTSSSLGDAVVDAPRRLLFEQICGSTVGLCRDIVARQDAFHAHRWRDRPAVSVHMSRPDACTVSTTIVEVTERDVRMVYSPAHCDAGTPAGLVIERQHAGNLPAHRPRRQHAAV